MTSDHVTLPSSTTIPTTACPVCDAPMSPPGSCRTNEIVECPECASELEVVSLHPVLLAVAPEVEEDWGE